MDKAYIFTTLDYLASQLTMLRSGMDFKSRIQDGRIDSLTEEGLVLKELEYLFEANHPKLEGWVFDSPQVPRHWFDFCLTHKNFPNLLIPVNIKSTAGVNADNCSSKEGLFYAMTGSQAFSSSYPLFFENLARVIKNNLEAQTDTTLFDYFFLVHLKNSNTFFSTGLKNIGHLAPNGNNLPFQCKWSANTHRVHRTEREAIHFVLSAYAASLAKRAEAHSHFTKFIEPLLKELSV